MLKNRQNQDNRSTVARGIAVGCMLAIVAYWVAFFSQPSILGFRGEAGSTLTRWSDLSMLLLVDELFAGMSGNGRLETGIFDRLPIAFAGIAYLALGWVIGYPAILFSGLANWLSRLEVFALSILSGLALLSTATLLVGLCGGLHTRWPLVAVVTLLMAISIWSQNRFRTWSDGNHAKAGDPMLPLELAPLNLPPTNFGSLWLQRLLPVAVVGMVVLYLLNSLMTPYEFDVVEYHLQAPKEFAAAGRIDFVPHNVYANMPLGTEMHALAMMNFIGRQTPDAWWWGGLIGKFVIGSYSLIAAALLGGLFYRHFGSFGGWSSAGIFLSVPGNIFVTNAGLIDVVVGAYLLAMLVVWTVPWPPKHLLACFGLTSLFAGAAAACKYPGFVYAVAPLGLVSAYWMIRTGMRPWRQMQLVGVGVIAMCLTCVPWLVKNAVQTGNPVYPLAANLFGGRELDPQRIEQWKTAHAVPSVDGSAYGVAALLKALRQLVIESPFLGPSLVAPAACGLLIWVWLYLSNRSRIRKPNPQMIGIEVDQSLVSQKLPQWIYSWFGLAAWILFVWYFATHRIDRFWLPVVPIYAGMAMLAVVFIARWLSVSLAALVVLISIGYTAFATASGTLGDHRFFVSLHALRNDAGEDDLPGRMSPMALWINQNLIAPTDKLLLVGEARVYDFVPDIEYATCFNENPAETLLRDKTVQEQQDNLRKSQVTHLLINWIEIARYRGPGNYGFSAWPQRSDVEQWINAGIVERVDWPFDSADAELFRVVRGKNEPRAVLPSASQAVRMGVVVPPKNRSQLLASDRVRARWIQEE